MQNTQLLSLLTEDPGSSRQRPACFTVAQGVGLSSPTVPAFIAPVESAVVRLGPDLTSASTHHIT